jgi:hypothetical protein
LGALRGRITTFGLSRVEANRLLDGRAYFGADAAQLDDLAEIELDA